MKKHTTNPEQTRHVNELHTLLNLRPCFGPNKLLCVEDHLENADLQTNTMNLMRLSGRHLLTRLVVFSAYAGLAYTLMERCQQFWIKQCISSVRYYLVNCASFTLRKVKLVRQLMADLPFCAFPMYTTLYIHIPSLPLQCTLFFSKWPCQPRFQSATIALKEQCTIRAPQQYWKNYSNYGNISTCE